MRAIQKIKHKKVFVVVLAALLIVIVLGVGFQHIAGAVMIPSTTLMRGLNFVSWDWAVIKLANGTIDYGKWNDRTFGTSLIKQEITIDVDNEGERFIRLLRTDIFGSFGWHLYAIGETQIIPFPPPPRPPLPAVSQ